MPHAIRPSIPDFASRTSIGALAAQLMLLLAAALIGTVAMPGAVSKTNAQTVPDASPRVVSIKRMTVGNGGGVQTGRFHSFYKPGWSVTFDRDVENVSADDFDLAIRGRFIDNGDTSNSFKPTNVHIFHNPTPSEHDDNFDVHFLDDRLDKFEGEVELVLTDDQDIQSEDGEPLKSIVPISTPDKRTYYLDATPPTVTAVSVSPPSPKPGDDFTVTVTFSEPMLGSATPALAFYNGDDLVSITLANTQPTLRRNKDNTRYRIDENTIYSASYTTANPLSETITVTKLAVTNSKDFVGHALKTGDRNDGSGLKYNEAALDLTIEANDPSPRIKSAVVYYPKFPTNQDWQKRQNQASWPGSASKPAEFRVGYEIVTQLVFSEPMQRSFTPRIRFWKGNEDVSDILVDDPNATGDWTGPNIDQSTYEVTHALTQNAAAIGLQIDRITIDINKDEKKLRSQSGKLVSEDDGGNAADLAFRVIDIVDPPVVESAAISGSSGADIRGWSNYRKNPVPGESINVTVYFDTPMQSSVAPKLTFWNSGTNVTGDLVTEPDNTGGWVTNGMFSWYYVSYTIKDPLPADVAVTQIAVDTTDNPQLLTDPVLQQNAQALDLTGTDHEADLSFTVLSSGQPKVLSASVSPAEPAPGEDFTVTVTFDEPMDDGLTPALTFHNGDDLVSLAAADTPHGTPWNDDKTTFSASYTTADPLSASISVTKVVVSNAQDESGTALNTVNRGDASALLTVPIN